MEELVFRGRDALSSELRAAKLKIGIEILRRFVFVDVPYHIDLVDLIETRERFVVPDGVRAMLLSARRFFLT